MKPIDHGFVSADSASFVLPTHITFVASSSFDGANFAESYEALEKVIATIRTERRPFLVHAKVPLLNHHTSGVRMEWYRDDLEEAQSRDPFPVLMKQLVDAGFTQQEIDHELTTASAVVKKDFEKALQLAPDYEQARTALESL